MLNIELPENIQKLLIERSALEKVSVDAIVRNAISEYLSDDIDDFDFKLAEIAIEEIKSDSKNLYPIEEVLNEIKNK